MERISWPADNKHSRPWGNHSSFWVWVSKVLFCFRLQSPADMWGMSVLSWSLLGMLTKWNRHRKAGLNSRTHLFHSNGHLRWSFPLKASPFHSPKILSQSGVCMFACLNRCHFKGLLFGKCFVCRPLVEYYHSPLNYISVSLYHRWGKGSSKLLQELSKGYNQQSASKFTTPSSLSSLDCLFWQEAEGNFLNCESPLCLPLGYRKPVPT